MIGRSIAYPLNIYYDASCPLCAEEMAALKEYDAQDRLRLIDCSLPGFIDIDMSQAGLTQEELMRRIHARDASGRWLDGVEVFEVAYRAAGIDAVARFWGYPRLQSLWDRIYMWIAGNRMLLSRFGLNKIYGYCVRRVAHLAHRRSRSCAGQGSCSAAHPLD